MELNLESSQSLPHGGCVCYAYHSSLVIKKKKGIISIPTPTLATWSEPQGPVAVVSFDDIKWELFYDYFNAFILKCLEFHTNGIINQSTNVTFIALVPKKSQTFKISYYRPISLVTSLYKIIAKVLSGRLRKVLHETISGS